MLGTSLWKKCMASTPRINERLGVGVAYHQCDRIEKYIDEVIRCASQSFPPGLKYLGSRPVSPEEQIKDITRYYRKKREYELAPSDLYHVAYEFEFNGEKLKTKYLRLPYIRPGGLIRIRGSSFVVSPVLEDNIFSITDDQIFMPVTRAKLTFKKVDVSFKVNGAIISSSVVYSPIYNIKKDQRHSARVSLLMHYILGQYGLSEAMSRFYNTKVVVGESEITEKDYPSSDWVICASHGIKPKGRGYTHYIPSTLRIAVPKDKFTPNVSSAIAAIFYIADREPDMVVPSYMDNILFWRRLLSRFIKSEVGLEAKAMEEMDAHFDSLNSYIDDLVMLRLQRENIPCGNIYEVLVHVMNTFAERTMGCKPADMIHNKRIDVVRPLLADIVYRISTLTFELVKMQGDRLNMSNISGVFDKGFPTNDIQNINKQHGEVNTLESATDCLLYSVTKNLVPQSKATFTKKGSRDSEMTDPAFALDSSQCVASTYLFITKSDPSARSAINHLMNVGENGEIIYPTHLKKELDDLDKLISTE